MFNIGAWEITVILIFALLLLGPTKLPEFARWVGNALREIRNATQDVKDAFDLEMERREFERFRNEFQNALDPQQIEKEFTSTFDPLQPPATEEHPTTPNPTNSEAPNPVFVDPNHPSDPSQREPFVSSLRDSAAHDAHLGGGSVENEALSSFHGATGMEESNQQTADALNSHQQAAGALDTMADHSQKAERI